MCCGWDTSPSRYRVRSHVINILIRRREGCSVMTGHLSMSLQLHLGINESFCSAPILLRSEHVSELKLVHNLNQKYQPQQETCVSWQSWMEQGIYFSLCLDGPLDGTMFSTNAGSSKGGLVNRQVCVPWRYTRLLFFFFGGGRSCNNLLFAIFTGEPFILHCKLGVTPPYCPLPSHKFWVSPWIHVGFCEEKILSANWIEAAVTSRQTYLLCSYGKTLAEIWTLPSFCFVT